MSTRDSKIDVDVSQGGPPQIWKAVPIGLLGGALAWMIAAMGVHAYSARRIEWLLVFPGALFGRAALVVQGAQWIAYAFLGLSIAGRRHRRKYAIALAGALVL